MEKQMYDFAELNIEELNSIQEISEDEMASVAYLCTCTCTGSSEQTVEPTQTDK